MFPVWNLLPDLACACPEHNNCGSPGKHPLVKSGLNVATTSADQIKKWWRKFPMANIGLNADRSGLLILDVDPRNGGNESLIKLEDEHGELPATYEVKTGGGGRHFYYRHAPVKSKPVAPGLDIKSRGGYVVAPPSSHHSGRPYEALHLGDPRGFILDAPPWLVTLCTADSEKPEKKPKDPKPKRVPVESGLFGAAFLHAGWLGEMASAPNARCARCPFDGEHTGGVKNAPSSSTVVFAPERGGVNGFVQCSHSHCGHRKQSEFWDAIPEASRKHAQKTLVVSPLYVPAESESWRASLSFDNKGKMKRVLGNASLILKNHPDFAGCLGYNEFKETYHWLRSPPNIMGLSAIAPGPVTDADFVQVSFYLAARYDMVEFSGDNVFSIMRSAAVPFHPVRQYFDGLVWDGTPRVFGWLRRYLGVESNPYSKAVGAWWLVSAVARILNPGCKADHVLIFEGPQGSRKSTALRTLADPWFADTPINLDSKDAYAALRGVWIYELQELQSLSKADSDKAKAFFSSPVDVYRKPYDRTTVEIKRQCVFAGTVNYNSYLKDGSGNRRYWPVTTDAIDIDALARDRDQLWAETLHLYNLGQRWYPETEDEHVMCGVEQDQRLAWEEDPWTTPVMAIAKNMDEVKAYEILPLLDHSLTGGRAERRDAYRISDILKAAGWKRVHTDKGKVWRRPPGYAPVDDLVLTVQ